MTMITMVETCEKRYNDNYDNQFIEVCLKNINVKDTIFSLVLLHSISYSSSNFTSTTVIIKESALIILSVIYSLFTYMFVTYVHISTSLVEVVYN